MTNNQSGYVVHPDIDIPELHSKIEQWVLVLVVHKLLKIVHLGDSEEVVIFILIPLNNQFVDDLLFDAELVLIGRANLTRPHLIGKLLVMVFFSLFEHIPKFLKLSFDGRRLRRPIMLHTVDSFPFDDILKLGEQIRSIRFVQELLHALKHLVIFRVERESLSSSATEGSLPGS